MFGMLDYRAHKLYWLISLPISVTVLILAYALVAGSFLYAVNVTTNKLYQIGITVLLLELSSLILGLLAMVVLWLLRRFFYFLVDLVPAEGRNKLEAREVLINGDSIRFIYKLKYQASLFDDEDQVALTKAAARGQGWIVKLIRLLDGSYGRRAFGATINERIDALVEAAKWYEYEQKNVEAFDSEMEASLRRRGLAPRRLEQTLSNIQVRHIIYRYVFLLICVVVYQFN